MSNRSQSHTAIKDVESEKTVSDTCAPVTVYDWYSRSPDCFLLRNMELTGRSCVNTKMVVSDVIKRFENMIDVCGF